MKKTEKIELRVDHAEKDRLSKIAERRGQTISDVVRDALAGELGSAPQSYPKWPGFVAICALAFAAGSLLWTTAGPMAGGNLEQRYSETQVAELGVRYNHLDIMKRRRPLETSLPLEDGYVRSYEFTVHGASYRLTVSSEQNGEDLLRYDLQVCRVNGEACDDMQISGFDLARRQHKAQSSGALSAAGPDGETIEIFVNVPRLEVEAGIEAESST